MSGDDVFQSAPTGLAVLSPDGTIEQVNRAGGRLLGSPGSALMGTRFADLLAVPCRAEMQRVLAQAVAQEGTFQGEVSLGPRGDDAPMRVQACALRRRKVSLLVSFADITQERAQADANRGKDDFIAMLAHELRGPLAPIRASISILQLAPLGSTAATSAVAILDRATAQLAKLVDELLDITRIVRGKLALHREVIELGALIRDVVAEQRAANAHRRLAIVVEPMPAELQVLGDPGRLIQVFHNVLGNAVKFTDDPAPSP